jgi:hypothetical protein
MDQDEVNTTQVSLQSLQFVKVIFKMLQSINEIYIGGDDTPFLLRLHGAGELDEIDVIAEFLRADDEHGFIERGDEAMNTAAIFVDRFPDYPILTQQCGAWKYFLLDDKPMMFSTFKEKNESGHIGIQNTSNRTN